MNRRNFFDTGTILCAIGAAFLVLREGLAKWYPHADRISNAFLATGILLSALGVLAFLVPTLIGLGNPIREGISNVVFRAAESPHVRVFAGAADLGALHDVYTHYFGDDVPSVELMRSWINRCESAFVLIYRETQKSDLSKGQELVGSYKVLPLTASGIEALKAGRASGATFKPEHISAANRRVSAYYIGDLFATDRTAKAVVLHELRASCMQFKNREITFYARPLTREGRHVMTRRGFVQVSDGSSKPEVGKLCSLQTMNVGL